MGAPKCGTTAMDEYLKQHPDIFMAKKELHYFGSDLPMKNRISASDYSLNFINTGNKKIIGESSVWYLFSHNAAKEIFEFSPDSKILIMLRNPVNFLTSLHSQHIHDGNEDVRDFETAIQLDEERRKGNNQPRCVDFTSLPPYKDVALFSEQVKRYLDTFDNENVHIIIYEEFAKEPETSTKKVLAFLGVDTNHPIEYRVINPNRKIRLLFLHRLIKMPAGWLKQMIRILIPVKRARHRIMHYLQQKNITEKQRRKMSQTTERYLKDFFADDISKLEKILGRELPQWR